MVDKDRVALAIIRFKVAWASVANESSIDHDGNVVAEGFSLVHPVSGQDQSGVW